MFRIPQTQKNESNLVSDVRAVLLQAKYDNDKVQMEVNGSPVKMFLSNIICFESVSMKHEEEDEMSFVHFSSKNVF